MPGGWSPAGITGSDMSSEGKSSAADQQFRRTLETTIRLGLVLIILIWCFSIIKPFIMPVMWGVIIAVACYPMHQWLARKLGAREKSSMTVLVVIGLAILILPVVMLAGSTTEAVSELAQMMDQGTLNLPPPPEDVKEWPLIGERLYVFWTKASTNLEETLLGLKPQLAAASKFLLSAAAGTGFQVLMFVVAILMAGFFMVSASSCKKFTEDLAKRLTGERGADLAKMATMTVRSVAQGVLGIAVIQAILAAIGMVVVGVPAAGLWAIGVLVLAVAQLPPWLILLPVAGYVFSVESTVVSVIFLVYAIVVSLSDMVLKPMLLGRGVDVPMPVILLGAIGGMITSGIIGLFVGAVVLSLGYELFMAWLRGDAGAAESTASS